MKQFFKNPKNLIIALAIIALLGFGSTLLISGLNTAPQVQRPTDTIQVTNPKTGVKMTFSRDGKVTFDNGKKTYSAFWDESKIASFFDYVLKNLNNGTGQDVTLDINGVASSGSLGSADELINVVGNQISGRAGGSNGSGGSINQYFNTPIPSTGSSGSSPTVPPSAPSWCIHWRLSYCADALYPPSNAPTPTPAQSGEIQASDCREWNSQSNSQTTLGDSNCNKATPTPNSNPYGY